MMYIDLLRDPDAFFARQSSGIGIRAPISVLATIALLGVVTAGVQTYSIHQTVPQASGSAVALAAIAAGLAGLFTPFLTWLLFAVGIFAIVRFLGGTGQFRPTMKAVGLGFVPKVFGSIVGLIATVVVIQTGVLNEAASVGEFVTQLQAHQARYIARTLNNVFLVWSGFLWVFGVKHVHDVDFRSAALAAGIPTAVSICYGLYLML